MNKTYQIKLIGALTRALDFYCDDDFLDCVRRYPQLHGVQAGIIDKRMEKAITIATLIDRLRHVPTDPE